MGTSRKWRLVCSVCGAYTLDLLTDEDVIRASRHCETCGSMGAIRKEAVEDEGPSLPR